DRVTGKMLYFAPNAIPGHSTTVNSEYSAAATQPLMWFANSGHDNDGINLYTASNRYFGSKVGKGLQLGVSYVPNGCQDFSAQGSTAGCGGGFSSTANGGLSQQYAIAANYVESFGSVDAALYAGYNSVHIENSSTDPRQAGWQLGAQFAYNVGDGSAIQLGGGYSNEDRSATIERTAWSAGLKYLTNGSKPGSVGIGVEYHNRVDETVGSADNELDYYTFGVTYQLATAVQTFAGVGVSDNDTGTASTSAKQTFGVVGLGLRF
ncbi:hypothetical protein, partial [Ferrovibrio sp.]|uniref:hypothetical protein n=1 Tax=Ferrovibrio sp. TaxID=1917215 RepID=UPI0035169E98